MTAPPTSNLPLRNGKASLYEGGVREPCIVVWPGVTKAGTENDTVIQSIDWMPTLLSIAGVPLPKEAKPDGVDVSAVLKGGKLEREAIFCHFPHDTPASGQHPGTSVRRGEWKLIRLFAGNEDGSDKLELYNLKDDIGETKDVSAEKPEIVRDLNGLITGFLKNADAVVPKANPNFKLKPAEAVVAGWSSSKDATLAMKDGIFIIASTGTDPYVITRELGRGTGPFTVEFKMKSNSRGAGQIFWATAETKGFHRDRSVIFEPKHDSEWHAYEVKLPIEKAIVALRIDPSAASGEIQLQSLRLKDKDGKTIHNWSFAAQEKK